MADPFILTLKEYNTASTVFNLGQDGEKNPRKPVIERELIAHRKKSDSGKHMKGGKTRKGGGLIFCFTHKTRYAIFVSHEKQNWTGGRGDHARRNERPI
jgi:hypothetical protein